MSEVIKKRERASKTAARLYFSSSRWRTTVQSKIHASSLADLVLARFGNPITLEPSLGGGQFIRNKHRRGKTQYREDARLILLYCIRTYNHEFDQKHLCKGIPPHFPNCKCVFSYPLLHSLLMRILSLSSMQWRRGLTRPRWAGASITRT